MLADDCGISQPTAKAWFSIREASFVAFHLPAFNVRHRKRLVKMPKLYFHDTGLACWLLGIREPRQLRTHPLQGAVFETWVVSDVLKHRIHRGESGGLSSYRDRSGTELDLVVDGPDGLTLVEAKSSATPASSLLDGARRVRPHLEDRRPRCEAAVVYGGEEVQQRRTAGWFPGGSCVRPRRRGSTRASASSRGTGRSRAPTCGCSFPTGRGCRRRPTNGARRRSTCARGISP